MSSITQSNTLEPEMTRDSIASPQSVVQLRVRNGIAQMRIGDQVISTTSTVYLDFAVRLASPQVTDELRTFLESVADFMDRNVNMQGGGPEDPPDYASSFDYELAQCAAELRMRLSAPPAAETPVNPEHMQLFKFYNVDSTNALVRMMEKHIERLQSKVPKLTDEFPVNPRKG